jgi:hypothetical protein
MNSYFIVLTILASAGFEAQPSVREQEFRQRVGLMSEAVAREKLKVYGVTDVRTFKAGEYTFDVEAVQDGRPVTLRIDATRGIAREAGATLALAPGKAAASFVPQPDPEAVRRLNESLQHEQRPTLDRTPPEHLHVRPEGKPVP